MRRPLPPPTSSLVPRDHDVLDHVYEKPYHFRDVNSLEEGCKVELKNVEHRLFDKSLTMPAVMFSWRDVYSLWDLSREDKDMLGRKGFRPRRSGDEWFINLEHRHKVNYLWLSWDQNGWNTSIDTDGRRPKTAWRFRDLPIEALGVSKEDILTHTFIAVCTMIQLCQLPRYFPWTELRTDLILKQLLDAAKSLIRVVEVENDGDMHAPAKHQEKCGVA